MSDGGPIKGSAAALAGVEVYTLVGGQHVGGREVMELVNGDLADDDLQEIITLSLFTWRRALDDDPMPEGASRHGWYGDDTFGSRLYLLKTLGPESIPAARQYAEEALRWMVDDGLVASVRVDGEIVDGQLQLSIEVAGPLQAQQPRRYAYLWRP